MQRSCAQCGLPFEIIQEEKEFLEKTFATKFAGKEFTIPEPEICPECRSLNRCAFRNERTLYKRQCSMCNKEIVTMLSGDRPFPVHCPDCWWSDSWNEEDYGRDFDFSRPFFDQLKELQDDVPRLSMNYANCENSEYTNQGVDNKNCYLIFASDENEDCYCSHWLQRSKDTADCNNVSDSTLCYDLIDCERCYHCIRSQDLQNCTDCLFCFNLIGCENCIRCAGLRNKQYWIDNKKASKEEYEAESKRILSGSSSALENEKKKFVDDIRLRCPQRYAHIVNCEDCTGDYISSSKRCHQCYDVFDSEDCLYASNLVHQHYQAVDTSYATETRRTYQVQSAIGESFFFSIFPWYGSNIWYCDSVKNSHNLFGCVGSRRKEYCILNKKYSQEEYEELASKLITHMQSTNEWGKFFPPALSPYAYNETVAMDYHRLPKEKAISYGYRWKENIDEMPQVEKVIPAEKLPDSINDIPDDILNWAIKCESTSRPFRIVKQELNFYRKMKLPIPHFHPDERHRRRMALRNPRKLWNRKCEKCQKDIQTTYSPEQPEKVFCEECYLKEVY